MADFLTEQDCAPNMNTAMIAGRVLRTERLKGKSEGLMFVVGYQKHWPSGGVQEIPIRCYVSGQERIDRLGWLKRGEMVLIQGEITDKNAVYAHRLEQLSKAEREPGEDDEYLAGMQKSHSSKA
jgi:hypothetical protein